MGLVVGEAHPARAFSQPRRATVCAGDQQKSTAIIFTFVIAPCRRNSWIMPYPVPLSQARSHPKGLGDGRGPSLVVTFARSVISHRGGTLTAGKSMRDVLGFRAMVAFGLVAVVAMVPAWADDPTDAEKEQIKRWEKQFRESLDWYQVFSGRDSRQPMKPEAVLRWVNPIRGQKGEPTLLLWADAGRPEALSSTYPWQGNLTYELVSLARETGLNAREDGRSVWSPSVAGVTFRDGPDARPVENGDDPAQPDEGDCRAVQARVDQQQGRRHRGSRGVAAAPQADLSLRPRRGEARPPRPRRRRRCSPSCRGPTPKRC